MERTAFISHASEDAAVAYELCTQLEQAGIACWIAPRDVTPGNDYGSEIIHGIEACPVFVLLLSAAANASPFVPRELERAASKGKRVFPVRIAEVLPDRDMELFVSSSQWIDALQPPRTEQWQRLARAIRGERTATASPAAGRAASVAGISAAEGGQAGRRRRLPFAFAVAALVAAAGGALMVWRGGEPPDDRSRQEAARGGADPAVAPPQAAAKPDAARPAAGPARAGTPSGAAGLDPCPQSLVAVPNPPTPFTCRCDARPRQGMAVWGTDVYTADSDLCRAARHAGVVAADGGEVTVEVIAGRDLYPGTVRNGVRSNDYGRYDLAIHFVGTPMPAEPGPCPASLVVNFDLATPFSCVCDAVAVADATGAVWGTDLYTADSWLCRAARHAGVVGAEGGTITVELTAGRSLYVGSQRNGVASNDYGPYSLSLRFR
jgi:hypothetical protein